MSSPHRYLIDASALIAFIRKETGWEAVLNVLSSEKTECLVSAIQMVEVEGKLVSGGSFTPQQVRNYLGRLAQLLSVVDFPVQAQHAASFYYTRRSPYNLSLGDALCLGLAESLGSDVLTAEQGWQDIPDLPFRVTLIR